MKTMKKIFALILAVMMIATVVGCHPKNEVAVTIGDYDFTSAYYMCALMAADSEAKTKVDEQLAEKKEEKTEEVDYYSQKIDGKDYVEWVEDAAIEKLKKIAAYKKLCKENKLELDEETESNVTSYAEYYWTSYGNSYVYEPNGVSKATYTNYMRDSYYSSLHFEFVYGEDGEKEISLKDVKKTINANFVIANVLSADFSEMTEDEVKKEKAKFKTYAKELEEGKVTFDEVYNEYNGVKETDKEETEEDGPKDKNASIIGSEDTTYASEYYDEIKKMKIGAIKLIEAEDESGISLVVKLDITKDKYYYENLDIEARHLIADEEYEAYIADYIKDMNADINKYAVKQFKVKNIKEPTYQ